jgi:hypothetical protein
MTYHHVSVWSDPEDYQRQVRAMQEAELVTWFGEDGTEHETPESEMPDDLEQVSEHRNDLGDGCPYSGAYTGDGTCPQYCHEADVDAGFDAGDRELPMDTDLPDELSRVVDGVRYAVHPGREYPQLED